MTVRITFIHLSLDSHYISIRKNQATVFSGFRSGTLCGCCAFARVHMVGQIDRAV